MSTEPNTSLATAPVTPGFHRATSALSETLGVDPRMMVETLKKQCFPSQRPDDVTDAQLAAFISVANSLKLNPLIPGMLYAYPSKNGGIVPVQGPDGVLKKLDEGINEGKLDGFECEVFPEDVTLPPTHAVAKIYRKGSDRPSAFTAIFKEWVVGSNPNWSARPRHMIWLRAIKQCARQVIHGVPFDEDDVTIGNMADVTPPDRPAAPPREPKGAATVAKNPPKKADPKIVEAEFTEAKKPDVEAELADDPKKAAEAEAKATPPPATEPPKTEPAKTARALLKPNEEIEVVCTVVEVTPTMLDLDRVNAPSVQVKLKGEYMGEALHHKGGIGDNNAVTPLPVWVVGSTVKVKLFGRQFKTGVRTMVLGVEAVAAAKGMILE